MKKLSSMLLLLLFFSFLPLDSLGAAPKEYPVRVRMVLVKVGPLLERQKYQEVMEILKEFTAKANGPDDRVYNHAEINFILGNCYALMDRPGEATGYFKRAVVQDPQHEGAWINMATSLYQTENYLEAGDAFLKSYELTEKEDAKHLYYSALTLLMAGKYPQFLERFEQLFKAHPDAVTLEWKESYVYGLLHANQTKKAIPYIVELARDFTGKKQRQWREILLQQYMALEMYKEALKFLEYLTRQETTEPLWWKGLAHLYLQTGDHKKALAALTIYSFLSPLSDEERQLIADLYMQEGIPRKAVLHYEKQVETKPERDLLLRLSRSYLELDLPDKALDSLGRIEGEDKNGEVAMAKGNILYSMKKYNQAATAFEEAAKVKGGGGNRAHLMAGYSYWQLGRHFKAREVFLKASANKEVQKEAKKAIENLEKVIAAEQSG